jgi:putative copper resistance protein D
VSSAADLPPLTTARAWTEWQFEPVLVTAVVLAAAAYLAGVRGARRNGERWPLLRTLSFLVPGLGGFVATTLGGVGAYSGRLFWAYCLRLALVTTLVPAFLAAGRPVSLLRAAVRPVRRPAVERFLAGPFSAATASPLLAPVVVPLLCAAVLFTPLFAATLRHDAVDQVVLVVLVAGAGVVLLPVVGDGEEHTSLSIGVGVLLGVGELVLDALPGLFVRLNSSLLAGSYWTAVPRDWGPDPRRDQHIGGNVLWVLAELIDLPFLLLLAVRWVHADAREAAVIDRHLDAEEPANAPELLPPWWLTEKPGRYEGNR